MKFQKTPDWLDWYAGPSKPRFKLPEGAVDAHCHVFGPGAKFPFAPERKYTPCDASKEQLFALRDHLGFARNVIVEFNLFVNFMQRHTNVWSKVSCPERLSVSGPPALHGEPHPYRDVIPFAKALIETFPDRVVWGTDWPHPNLKGHMPDDGLLVDFIPRIATTPELQRRLLVGNPMRL